MRFLLNDSGKEEGIKIMWQLVRMNRTLNYGKRWEAIVALSTKTFWTDIHFLFLQNFELVYVIKRIKFKFFT